MSEEKRYYWFKMEEDFLKSKEIKKLRLIAGGDTYVIIYLKLILLSLKNNGKLFFEGFEDDIIKEIALDIDEKYENISVTFNYLKKHNIIVIDGENNYQINDIIKSIGSKTATALRVQKHRENIGKLQCNKNVTENVTMKQICNGELELELELEKDIHDSGLRHMSDVQEKLKTMWNEYATKHGLSSLRTLTDSRRKKIIMRIKKNKNYEQDFITALGKITESSFLLGTAGGWMVNFDWLIANDDNIVKVLEGKYSEKKQEWKPTPMKGC